ncbi:MAG: hypothetical protein ABIR04_01690, partial [Cypionkella sp.]
YSRAEHSALSARTQPDHVPPSVASSHLLRPLPHQAQSGRFPNSPAAPFKGARCPCERHRLLSTSRRTNTARANKKGGGTPDATAHSSGEKRFGRKSSNKRL